MTLKTEYKYIVFKKELGSWACKNKKHGDHLGTVVYSPMWKQFVFQPRSGTEFSTDCLRDIADFLEQLNKQKREGTLQNENS